MTRRSFKMAILGLIGFTFISAIAYLVFTTIVNAFCYALLYAMKNPANALLFMVGLITSFISLDIVYKRIKK